MKLEELEICETCAHVGGYHAPGCELTRAITKIAEDTLSEYHYYTGYPTASEKTIKRKLAARIYNHLQRGHK